ncbi:MAG TPA: response regulator transcription factor [Clostridia bacterium]|nr:response regulator transcription factor [Clostridia bacterium]
MIRVVIADDHDLIRDGFRRLIEDEPSISWAGEARTAEELFKVLESIACDVVLLDLSLPDRSGLDVVKDIRVSYPHCRVLILSMHPEERYAQRALQGGAAGYISKGKASEELIEALHSVGRGERYISSTYARQMVFDKAGNHPPHNLLTDREFQVLLLIGEGKSVGQIAEHLNMSINTVYTHRRKLMEKMQLYSNTELVHYALEYGLIE